MRAKRTAVTLAMLAVIAAGCGGGSDGTEGGGGEGEPIQFWTTLIEPDRVEAQNAIIERFTEQSGIEVELVSVAEDELSNLMVSNAASGSLPEVVYHAVEFAIGWAEQGLLDPAAANAVVESLGRDTFNERALELATFEDDVASVPSDAWGQLLVYRSDLFEQAGLEPPDTYDAILAAAEALHDPGASMYGITASTDPADVFTQQTFEHFALANGCRLVEGDEVALGSDACVEAIDTYQTLINDYSPGSVQNVDTTRATYFAGQAGMVIWSPFILDELAGLRNDALPTCPECEDNPRFLAENSAFVPAFSGSGGEPSQYGAVAYFGIGAGSDTEPAQQFVEFMMSDGYLDWLAIAPEGMFPMRSGTQENPEEYLEGWRDLEIGVDDRAAMSDVYGDEVIDTLVQGTEQFDRWGFEEGYGSLVSAVYASLIVPQTLAEVLEGTLDAQAAAEQLQTEATEELEALPGAEG
jgi:multiple sugar transport system substrate-binding protein